VGIGVALGALAADVATMRIRIDSLEYVEQRHQQSIDNLHGGHKLCFDMVYRGEQLRLQEIATRQKSVRA
jgi:hypothetical protein